MNQEEIKQWLEWVINTLSNEAESNIVLDTQVKPDLIIMHWHGFKVAQIEPNEEVYMILPLMQIALQEEIRKKENWNVMLWQNNLVGFCLIKCPYEVAAEADTILEAMMLAFRETWEATHG